MESGTFSVFAFLMILSSAIYSIFDYGNFLPMIVVIFAMVALLHVVNRA